MRAPHPPLPEYYREESDRGSWVKQIFDRTAGDYDRIERAMSLGTGSHYRRRALRRAGLMPGMRVLDIGAGTGLTARQAADLVGASGHVTGVDPSVGMIKSANVPAGVEMLVGSAEAIPAESESADFLCMGYALRHVRYIRGLPRVFARAEARRQNVFIGDHPPARDCRARVAQGLHARGGAFTGMGIRTQS